MGVAARPRGPVPPQRQRVPRGPARRGQGPLRRRQHQLPLRGRRAPLRPGRQPAPTAIVYHGAFAATLAEVLPVAPPPARCSPGRRRLRHAAPPGRRRLRGRRWPRPRPRRPSDLSPDDLYILYTGGTTGHAQGRAVAPGRLPGRVPRASPAPPTSSSRRPRTGDRCGSCRRRRSCTAPPTGTRSAPGSPAAPWSSRTTRPPRPRRHARHRRPRAASPRCSSWATPSPARWSTRCAPAATTSTGLRFLLTGGAVLSAVGQGGAARAASRSCSIVDVLGSSETGRQGVHTLRPARGAPHRHLRPLAHRRGARPRTSPACSSRATASSAGWPRPGGCRWATWATRTRPARTFPVVDGVRYAVAGDRARLARRRRRSSSTAATRSPSTPAARRCSPRRSSRPSSATRRCSTPSWSAGRASAGARRSWPSCSCVPRRDEPTDDELRAAAARPPRPLQAPEGLRPGPADRAQPQRQARLPLGRPPSPPERERSWPLRHAPVAFAAHGAAHDPPPVRRRPRSIARGRCALGKHDPTIHLGRPRVAAGQPHPRRAAPPSAPSSTATGSRSRPGATAPSGRSSTAPGCSAASTTGPGSTRRPESCAGLHRDGDGLRLPRTGRVLEALIPAVLGQRVTGFEAKRSYRQLVERWGEPAPGPAGSCSARCPATIAELGYYDLHLIGVEKKRADTLKRVCAHATRLEEVGRHGARPAPRAARGHPRRRAVDLGRGGPGRPSAIPTP